MNQSIKILCLCFFYLLSYNANTVQAQLFKKISDKVDKGKKIIESVTQPRIASDSNKTNNNSPVGSTTSNSSGTTVVPTPKVIVPGWPALTPDLDFAQFVEEKAGMLVCNKNVSQKALIKQENVEDNLLYFETSGAVPGKHHSYLLVQSLGHCTVDKMTLAQFLKTNIGLIFPGSVRIDDERLNKNQPIIKGQTYDFLSSGGSDYNFSYTAICSRINNFSINFTPLKSEEEDGDITIGVFEDACNNLYVFYQAKNVHDRFISPLVYYEGAQEHYQVWKKMSKVFLDALTRYCNYESFLITNHVKHYLGEKWGGGTVIDLDSTMQHGLIISATNISEESGVNDCAEAVRLAKAYRDAENHSDWRLFSDAEFGVIYVRRKFFEDNLTGDYWCISPITTGTGCPVVGPSSVGNKTKAAFVDCQMAGMSVRVVRNF